MTQFEVFNVPPDAAARLRNELETQFERYAVGATSCWLVGSQHNTLIEVRFTPNARHEVRFLIPLEDIALGDFARLIEDALEMNGHRVRAPAGQAS